MTPIPDTADSALRLAIPKGRMHEGVVALLADAGVRITASARGYRPRVSLPDTETKVLKPQNIVEMLDAGSRDAGFAGADWVEELNADVVEILDTGLDAVRIVAAAPPAVLDDGAPPARPLVVASEFERIARRWIDRRNRDDRFLRSYGATEVFPPEDADCVIDVAASGATLEANNLVVFETLMHSSTRLYASRRAMETPEKRRAIEDLALVLRSVLEARKRVMLEVNVAPDRLEAVVAALPCMREPTVALLHAGAGYAVKAAVPRDALPTLIPAIKAQGGADIVISPLSQVTP
ncbi:MAG: ATP phosphoribosyltransferase [Phycisphaerales bacterium]|nr:MAG: ATP phosphoribosyltransferase [Phycisphaerales bacterium]